MKVLITSGGTKIPIDRVRFITNMSNGTFGSQIADSFGKEKNTEIIFIHAKGSKIPHCAENNNVRLYEYETFWQYESLLKSILVEYPDIVILAAAVSDYEVENIVDGKIRTSGDMVIRLKELPKLIGVVKKRSPNSVLCGFKLLVGATDNDLIEASEKSIRENGCDLVVANDLLSIRDTKNHSMIIVKNGWYKKFYRKDACLSDVVKHFCMVEYLVR